MRSPLPRTTIACVLIASTSAGCLTQPAFEHWTGRDRIEAIGFQREAGNAFRWSVRGDDVEREGTFTIAPPAPGCGHDTLYVAVSKGLEAVSVGRWTWALLDPGRIALERPEWTAPLCHTIVALESIGIGHDPLFSMERGGEQVGTLEVKPPRRRSAGVLIPLAFLVDAAVITGYVWLIGGAPGIE